MEIVNIIYKNLGTATKGVARGLITKMVVGQVLTMNRVYCRARE